MKNAQSTKQEITQVVPDLEKIQTQQQQEKEKQSSTNAVWSNGLSAVEQKSSQQPPMTQSNFSLGPKEEQKQSALSGGMF